MGSRNFFLEKAKNLRIFAFKVEEVCGYNDALVKCPRGLRELQCKLNCLSVLSSSSLLLVREARITQRRKAKGMEVVPSLYRHLGLAALVNNIATVTNFLSVPFLISLAQTELRVIALIEA